MLFIGLVWENIGTEPVSNGKLITTNDDHVLSIYLKYRNTISQYELTDMLTNYPLDNPNDPFDDTSYIKVLIDDINNYYIPIGNKYDIFIIKNNKLYSFVNYINYRTGCDGGDGKSIVTDSDSNEYNIAQHFNINDIGDGPYYIDGEKHIYFGGGGGGGMVKWEYNSTTKFDELPYENNTTFYGKGGKGGGGGIINFDRTSVSNTEYINSYVGKKDTGGGGCGGLDKDGIKGDGGSGVVIIKLYINNDNIISKQGRGSSITHNLDAILNTGGGGGGGVMYNNYNTLSINQQIYNNYSYNNNPWSEGEGNIKYGLIWDEIPESQKSGVQIYNILFESHIYEVSTQRIKFTYKEFSKFNISLQENEDYFIKITISDKWYKPIKNIPNNILNNYNNSISIGGSGGSGIVILKYNKDNNISEVGKPGDTSYAIKVNDIENAKNTIIYNDDDNTLDISERLKGKSEYNNLLGKNINYVTGLKWINKGLVQPSDNGIRLYNDSIEYQLTNINGETKTFTQKQWNDFGIENLQYNSYIKVGNNYFKPIIE